MNNKGNIFLGTFIAIFLFSMGVLFIPFLVDNVTIYRTDMDCTNSTITDGTKLSCLQGDLIIPYAILFFSSIAIGYIAGGKFL